MKKISVQQKEDKESYEVGSNVPQPKVKALYIFIS